MVTLENTRTVYDLVQNTGEEYGRKVYLRYEQNDMVYEKSYYEFAKVCKAAACYIDKINKNEGKKIHAALIGKTSYYYLISLLGIMSAGSIAVPLDAQLSKEEIVECLEQSDVDIIFYDWEFKSQIEVIKGQCKNIKQYICLQKRDHVECAEDIFAMYLENSFISDAKPKDCAIIIFTSGTTGTRKGVMLSNENLIDNTFCSTEKECQDKEVFLNVLPIHHIFCLNGDIFLVMRYGSTLCLNNDLSKMLYYIKLFQPSVIRLVPMIAKVLYNKISMTAKQNSEKSLEEIKISVLGKKLHKIISGGGYLSKELASKFLNLNITISQGYGMSECSPKITAAVYDRTDKISSVGQVVDRCQVRIIDGEIQVKSPSVMMGYYKDPYKTKEVITEDGWLKTGDLGYLDEENFLYLTGRKKNLIILSNGENVSPESIENAFENEMLISDILVYGKDDTIAAEVYPNYKYAQLQKIDDVETAVQIIIKKYNEDLPSYKRISKCIVRKVPFEKTSSKKIIRQKYFEQKKEEEIKALKARKPENEIQQKIYESVAEFIGNKLFGIDSELYNCGLDSFGSIMLIQDLHDKFKKKITLNDLMKNSTVLKLEAFFNSKTVDEEIDLSVRTTYPLTGMQKYFAYIIKGNTTGNLPFTFKLDNNIDLNKLKRSIEEAIEAHPGLKAIIKFDKNQYKVFRDDTRKIDIPIIKLSEEEWTVRLKELLVPFEYTAEDNLFHIYIFETENSKYLFFDVAHIMGDGISMNILFEDINKLYCGKPIEKESYTFYEFILEEQKRQENGITNRDSRYVNELMKNLKMKRSILNKKKKEDYSCGNNAVIKKRFDNLTRKNILYFCRQNSVSENVLFLTAYNYCISLFSDEKDVFSTSIHSGRIDNRWTRVVGPLFLTYYFRYTQAAHERVTELLKKSGKQIMNTMRCYTPTPREGEMFFQYQGDIVNIDKIGDSKAEKIKRQLDSLPFHMQVMYDEEGYYMELRYWNNRFDREQLEIFITCYENILEAMLEERSVRRLKKHIPEEVYPKHLYVDAVTINNEAGYEMLKNVTENEKVKVYILDESYNKKPYGAWGACYIMDHEPDCYIDKIDNPYGQGVLYRINETARILPDNSIDFLENGGRIVLTDGSNGRVYYDLKKLEDTLKAYQFINYSEAYLRYDAAVNEMILIANIKGIKEPDIEKLKLFIEERCGKKLVPNKINYLDMY